MSAAMGFESHMPCTWAQHILSLNILLDAGLTLIKSWTLHANIVCGENPIRMSKHVPELYRFLEVLPLPQKEDTESSPLHGMRPCLAIVPVEGAQPTSPSATARVILPSPCCTQGSHVTARVCLALEDDVYVI